jgi:hypothetical protein
MPRAIASITRAAPRPRASAVARRNVSSAIPAMTCPTSWSALPPPPVGRRARHAELGSQLLDAEALAAQEPAPGGHQEVVAAAWTARFAVCGQAFLGG